MSYALVVEISNMSGGQIFSENLCPLVSCTLMKCLIFEILFLLYWVQQNTF